MPIYEYKCKKCGKVFEILVKNGEDEPKKCSECGGELQKLLSTGTGLVFKGSWFYVTDYGNKHSSAGTHKPKRTEKKNDKIKDDNSK